MAVTATSGEPARSEKWTARREAIVDTSAQVFARQGYHATGIVELCDANGLGKGAFYHYIGSKEELLAAIHDRVMDEVMLGAERVADAGRSEEHTSELQSLMRNSYAVFCLKKKKINIQQKDTK